MKKCTDIRYANESEAQKLDLYLPEVENGSIPVVVFIHGGAFRFGDKADTQVRPFLEVVKYGYALASLNYRLSAEALFPVGIQDCKTALCFLKSKEKEFGIDASRIGLAGDSSGANYTLMLAASQNIVSEQHLEEKMELQPVIRCAVSWYAPVDFLQMDAMLIQNRMSHAIGHNSEQSPESLYLGGQITKLDPDLVQKANPITYLTPELPPILLQHGRQDETVPFQQSVIFAEKAAEIAGKEQICLEILEGAGHADKKFEQPENMKRIISFLDQYLK